MLSDVLYSPIGIVIVCIRNILLEELNAESEYECEWESECQLYLCISIWISISVSVYMPISYILYIISSSNINININMQLSESDSTRNARATSTWLWSCHVSIYFTRWISRATIRNHQFSCPSVWVHSVSITGSLCCGYVLVCPPPVSFCSTVLLLVPQ